MSHRHLVKLTAALALVATLAQAQDTPTATAAAPVPAEPARLASSSLLLAAASTGSHYIAVGERGNIVASKDGERWAQVEVPVRSTLTGISFADATHGWAVGHDATILATVDGGRSWKLQHFAPEAGKPLLNVLFTDDRHGYAVGAFGLFLVTEDGGASWTELAAPGVREEGLHLNALTRLDDGSLLVVGEAGMLGISSDGREWQRLKSPYEGSFFGAVARGPHGVIAYGLRGNVYVSDDPRGGEWKRIDLDSTLSLFGGLRLADGSTVLVGADSTIVVIDADGKVKARLGKQAGALGSGSLMSVLPWGKGLLMAGELGIERRKGLE